MNTNTVLEQIEIAKGIVPEILPQIAINTVEDIFKSLTFCDNQLYKISGAELSAMKDRIKDLQEIFDFKLSVTKLMFGLTGDSTPIIPNVNIKHPELELDFKETVIEEKGKIVKHNFTTGVTESTSAETSKIELATDVVGTTGATDGNGQKLSPSAVSVEIGKMYAEKLTITKLMEIFMHNNVPTMWSNPLYWKKDKLSPERIKGNIMRMTAILKKADINPNDFFIEDAGGKPVRIFNWEPYFINKKGEYINGDGKVTILDTPVDKALETNEAVVNAETEISNTTEETTDEIKSTEFFPEFKHKCVVIDTDMPKDLVEKALIATKLAQIDVIVDDLIKKDLIELALNYSIDCLVEKKNGFEQDPFTQEEVEKRFINEILPFAMEFSLESTDGVTHTVEDMGTQTLAKYIDTLRIGLARANEDDPAKKEEIINQAEELAYGAKPATVEEATSRVKTILISLLKSGMTLSNALSKAIKTSRAKGMAINTKEIIEEAKATLAADVFKVEPVALLKPIDVAKDHPDVYESAKLCLNAKEGELASFTSLVKAIVFDKKDNKSFKGLSWMIAANLSKEFLNKFKPSKDWDDERKLGWFKSTIDKESEKRKAAKTAETAKVVEADDKKHPKAPVSTMESQAKANDAKKEEKEVILGPEAPIAQTEVNAETTKVEPKEVNKYTKLISEEYSKDMLKKNIELFFLDDTTGSTFAEKNDTLKGLFKAHKNKKFSKPAPRQTQEFINSVIAKSTNEKVKAYKAEAEAVLAAIGQPKIA